MIRHIHNALALIDYLLEQGLFPLATGAGVVYVLAGRSDRLASLIALMVAALAVKALVVVTARALAERIGGGQR